MDDIIKERYELVKSMNIIVRNLNDETAYSDNWISVVSDLANDDDLESIAEDEELFNDVVKMFKIIMNAYTIEFCLGSLKDCKVYPY